MIYNKLLLVDIKNKLFTLWPIKGVFNKQYKQQGPVLVIGRCAND